MAKNNPFDLPPGVLDAIRQADRFIPDPATERFLREAASISESYAATLQHFKTTDESLGWCDTFAAIRSAQHDYVAQFAQVRESLDSFARITDESTLASVAQIRAFHDSWLKEATQAQALIGPSLELFRARCSDLLGLTEASLTRLQAGGNLAPMREVRKAYARFRRDERAVGAGDAEVSPDESAVHKAADKEARRSVSGTGQAKPRGSFDRGERFPPIGAPQELGPFSGRELREFAERGHAGLTLRRRQMSEGLQRLSLIHI